MFIVFMNEKDVIVTTERRKKDTILEFFNTKENTTGRVLEEYDVYEVDEEAVCFEPDIRLASGNIKNVDIAF